MAVLQTAKKAIYMFCLLKTLKLSIFEVFLIDCDNAQTRQLLVDKLMKLQTKLRQVDIHSHWLQQEVQRGSININWVFIKQMIANGLTKIFSVGSHKIFARMIELEDQSNLLKFIRKEKKLKESL